MKKIFYADKSRFSSSIEAVQLIFEKYYNLKNVVINRNEHGKPYLENNNSYFFSVTHTKELLLIAVSPQNVGIDAELLERKVEYSSILKKFSSEEKEHISSEADFLVYWTTKESVIKWLGGSLGLDLSKIRYEKNQAYYKALPLPVSITHKRFQNHILSICSEENFKDVEFFPI